MAAVGTIAAVALAAAAWEILTALLWIILVITAATVIALTTAAVIARRMNQPVHITPARPAPAITAGPPRRDLENRLRAAEINATAAIMAAQILAQHARPLPLSGFYSDTERVIRND